MPPGGFCLGQPRCPNFRRLFRTASVEIGMALCLIAVVGLIGVVWVVFALLAVALVAEL